MKELQLGGRGGIVQVDDEDYEFLSLFKWSKDGNGYAARYKTAALPYSFMHRAILTAPKGTQVDHIDGNPLNNQRSNLRLCTASQNACCAKTKSTNTYRGVSKHQNKYRVQIRVNRKVTHVGVFDCEEDAARAYDVVAKKHYGEFAILNFPEEI